jgi:hypothetical protein
MRARCRSLRLLRCRSNAKSIQNEYLISLAHSAVELRVCICATLPLCSKYSIICVLPNPRNQL